MANDWGLVGGDPAPGDAHQVSVLAMDIDRTGDLAHEARMTLEGISGSLESCRWEGAAATSFTSAFGNLAPDLGRMATSYEAVGHALADYAERLSAIQQAAQQALTRAHLASERRRAAENRLDAARGRIRDLNRQLAVVQLDEKVRIISVKLAVAADPLTAADEQEALRRVQARRRTVEAALNETRRDESSASNDQSNAAHDLDRDHRIIDGLRHDRLEEERRAASRIRDALDDGLKNRSNMEKASGWAGDKLAAARRLAAEHNLADTVIKVKQVLGRIEVVLLAAMAVLAVVCLAAAPFTKGASLAVLAKAYQIYDGISKVLDGLILGLTITQFALDLKDEEGHTVGLREVGTEAFWRFVVPLPGERAAARSLGHIKRHLAPNGQKAWGVVRKYAIVNPGRAIPDTLPARLPHLARAAAWGSPALLSVGKDAYDAAPSVIEWTKEHFFYGGSRPVVRPCYAN